MKKYLLAAVAALAISGSAMAHEPASLNYEARAQVAGFLIRAGKVCTNYDWRTMITTGMRLLAGPMRQVTNGYPSTVEGWEMKGVNLFNTGVMQDGVDAACPTLRHG